MQENPTQSKTDEKITVQYIILVRHGSRDKAYNKPRGEHRLENADYEAEDKHGHMISESKNRGLPITLSLARWLAETLVLYRDIRVSWVLCSPQKHAKETAEAYLEVLSRQGLCPENLIPASDSRLDVEEFWTDIEVHHSLTDQITATKNNQALMICGHQPQLTWIANALLQRRGPLPLRQSEAACLKMAPKRRLLWAICEDDEKTVDQLKEKIKSKTSIATFLSGFIALLLSIILTGIHWKTPSQSWPWAVFEYSGAALVLLAVCLCVATMFGYDRLMMPTVFWGGKPRGIGEDPPRSTIRRPPSQTHWVLYVHMARIWNRLFIPGVLAFFVGLTSILVGVVRPPPWMILVFIAMLLGAFGWYRLLRPDLGFDD